MNAVTLTDRTPDIPLCLDPAIRLDEYCYRMAREVIRFGWQHTRHIDHSTYRALRPFWLRDVARARAALMAETTRCDRED